MPIKQLSGGQGTGGGGQSLAAQAMQSGLQMRTQRSELALQQQRLQSERETQDKSLALKERELGVKQQAMLGEMAFKEKELGARKEEFGGQMKQRGIEHKAQAKFQLATLAETRRTNKAMEMLNGEKVALAQWTTMLDDESRTLDRNRRQTWRDEDLKRADKQRDMDRLQAEMDSYLSFITNAKNKKTTRDIAVAAKSQEIQLKKEQSLINDQGIASGEQGARLVKALGEQMRTIDFAGEDPRGQARDFWQEFGRDPQIEVLGRALAAKVRRVNRGSQDVTSMSRREMLSAIKGLKAAEALFAASTAADEMGAQAQARYATESGLISLETVSRLWGSLSALQGKEIRTMAVQKLAVWEQQLRTTREQFEAKVKYNRGGLTDIDYALESNKFYTTVADPKYAGNFHAALAVKKEQFKKAVYKAMGPEKGQAYLDALAGVERGIYPQKE